MARRRSHFGGEIISLAFPPSFENEYEDDIPLCRRDGGLPLTLFEQILVRLSFRFRRSRRAESEALTPDELIEQLANIVAGCIDRGAVASFGPTYKELVRFHRFLFEAQETVDSEGQPYNFALLPYFAAFEPPYRTWIRQYRRLFERAADKLDTEPEFIKRLAYTPRNLLPDDARDKSPVIVNSVLELGVQLPVMLEHWFARHTTAEADEELVPQGRLSLTGSDERAYRLVVYEFISAWESLAQMTPYTFHWAAARRGDVSQWWKAMTQSWSFYQTHLVNTAYIAGLAVWNQDQLGSDRYRDMLVKWLDTARPDIREEYLVPQKWLLLPADFLTDWPALKDRLLDIANRPGFRDIEADTLFTSFMRHLYDDVLIITTAVFLVWRASSPQLAQIAKEAAVAVYKRQHIDDGSFRRPRPQDEMAMPFRNAMSCIIRAEIGPRDGYGGFQDGLVRSLNGIVESVKIPGRIYGGFGWDGRQSLDLQMLAILLASLPERGDAGLCEALEDACGRPRLFAEQDVALRSIIQEFTRLRGTLREENMHGGIEESVGVLAPGTDFKEGVARLDKIMTDAISVIEKHRAAALLDAPLDAHRMAELRGAMLQVLRSLPNVIPWSKGTRFIEATENKPGVKNVFCVGVDKGRLTNPPMAYPSLTDIEVWVEMFLQSLIVRVMMELGARPREQVTVESVDAFWDFVMQRRHEIGPRQVVFVPINIANQVMEWAGGFSEKPDFALAVVQERDHATVTGGRYIATINGLDVMTVNGAAGMAFLCSAGALTSIAAAPLDIVGHLVDVVFEHDGDPRKGRLASVMALDLLWDESPMFEIRIQP